VRQEMQHGCLKQESLYDSKNKQDLCSMSTSFAHHQKHNCLQLMHPRKISSFKCSFCLKHAVAACRHGNAECVADLVKFAIKPPLLSGYACQHAHAFV